MVSAVKEKDGVVKESVIVAPNLDWGGLSGKKKKSQE